MDDTDEIKQAGTDAEAVAQAVRSSGTPNPVYGALEESLAAYLDAGGSVDDVIPGGDSDGLGFGRRSGTGRSWWRRYVDVLHDEVCKPGGELNQVLSAGLVSSARRSRIHWRQWTRAASNRIGPGRPGWTSPLWTCLGWSSTRCRWWTLVPGEACTASSACLAAFLWPLSGI